MVCCKKYGDEVVYLKEEKMCEDCEVKHADYGLETERKNRWCSGCGEKYGAVSV